MKSKLFFIVFFIASTIVCCEKNNTDKGLPFEAKVLGRNSDCGIFAIQFTKSIQQANEIAGTLYTEYTFIAKNLPSELQVEGLSIILNIRRIQDTELGECTAMGPSYPWIYVLEARKKNN